MRNALIKMLIDGNKNPQQWQYRAMQLEAAERSGQVCLVATPSLEACLSEQHGTAALEAFSASLWRLSDLSERDSEMVDLAARWLTRRGKDPRHFLQALAEAVNDRMNS